MIDTGCKRSLDGIKYRLSFLEAESYSITCGICYCVVLGKQNLYFEEKTDICNASVIALALDARSFDPQCWEAQEDQGECPVLLHPSILLILEQCYAGSITEPSSLPLDSLWVLLRQIRYQAQLARSVSLYRRSSGLRLSRRYIPSKQASLGQTLQNETGLGAQPPPHVRPWPRSGMINSEYQEQEGMFDWLEQWPDVPWQEAWY